MGFNPGFTSQVPEQRRALMRFAGFVLENFGNLLFEFPGFS
jgi:hypothetical protein